MPPQERRRGDEEGHPAVPRNHPTGRGEEDPVDGPELGWAGPPTKDPKLVTEDQDLEVLGAVISATLATANEERASAWTMKYKRKSIGSSYESSRR